MDNLPIIVSPQVILNNWPDRFIEPKTPKFSNNKTGTTAPIP
jgi:hypothetical protein